MVLQNGTGPAISQVRWGHMADRFHISKSGERRLDGDVYICPLSRVPEVLARTGAQHLVTLINEQTMPGTPPGIAVDRHLKIAVNDIGAPQDGLIHPCDAHIGELIRFTRLWNRDGPLVVHCLAGISRSTAAAFITACALNPAVPEQIIAAQLRAASPTATPNRLLVHLADVYLARNGRMTAAVEAIGRGEPAIEARPFVLSTRFG
jgi:predicted protein tyrosine phosphatase